MTLAFNQLAFIAVGGAIGAVLRFLVSNGVHSFMSRDFPYGTLTVNVVGSFLMGLTYVMLIERLNLSPEWRAFIIVGLLGAFTTFSTFSIETLLLIESSELSKALINIILSVVLCIMGSWIGIILGRQL
ncbi:Fluoride ion transporter CrcB [hydrothermal vent metagenome]|uniref:Fluoride ion transporter CrcB n=1 Tax=hydrothermal vent metagenome TaxID=652676 RepID=A0A3B1A357_9ZZZZ